ncbi:hypothetical protein Taro_032735 [Colocasia esculenta]|uniref:Protein kinase domain-containing protein n=1 Tax=Colocasia esculenta TaxID=4460 RepID=A0A843WAA9_COLES|nr:hypothetical protein [Colocasia esculenta]
MAGLCGANLMETDGRCGWTARSQTARRGGADAGVGEGELERRSRGQVARALWGGSLARGRAEVGKARGKGAALGTVLAVLEKGCGNRRKEEGAFAARLLAEPFAGLFCHGRRRATAPKFLKCKNNCSIPPNRGFTNRRLRSMLCSPTAINQIWVEADSGSRVLTKLPPHPPSSSCAESSFVTFVGSGGIQKKIVVATYASLALPLDQFHEETGYIVMGSFSSVKLALAMPTSVKEEGPAGDCCPGVMAVKPSPLMESVTLSYEKEVLDRLAGCPEVVAFYGDEVSVEVNRQQLYNVFLEYLPGGSLSELYRGEPMAEDDVPRYAASMLQGLHRVHEEGCVHCDLKPQNMLITGPGRTKIDDFGLAKRAGVQSTGSGRAGFLRGTLLYMAPEFVEKSEYEPLSDVWSLDCVVSEMATGMSAWRYGGQATTSVVAPLLLHISSDKELSEIPKELSEEGRDFLGRCFVRKPSERLIVEMLLGHPFMEATAAAAVEASKSDGDDDGHSKEGNRR